MNYAGDIERMAQKAGMTVIDYIKDQHHNQGKSLYSLAGKWDVSPDYLRKLFKRLDIEFRPTKPNSSFNRRRFK